MFCSVVIPTIGRSTLSRAVYSVLNQEFSSDNFEIIVVNDSGTPLPRASWQEMSRVRILDTNRRERSVARNTGAAIATGDYLCFLDDDDWLLPGAFTNIWNLKRHNEDAVWLFGGIRIIDDAGKIFGEVSSSLNGNCFAQIMGGAWAPLQTSFIKSSVFFDVGGFNHSIQSTQDLDLCRRIAYLGELASITAPVACLFRGRTWNTSTNYLRAPGDTKRSRSDVLKENGSFRRLVDSVKTSDNPDYWRGRILRVYLSTVTYNLKQNQFFSAVSRGMFGLAWFLWSGRGTLSPYFWRGLKDYHVQDSLHFIMEKYERETIGY